MTGEFAPRAGTAWQLSAADTTDGGGVLSLVCAHAIADGAAMVDAIVRANGAASGLPVDPAPGIATAVRSDLRDAAGQLATVGRWVVSAVVTAVRSSLRKARASPDTASPAPASPSTESPAAASPTAVEEPAPVGHRWSVPHVVAECDSAVFARIAKSHGGSTNTLFSAMLTRMTAATGADPIPVALPVSARSDDDVRSNTTRIAQAAFPADALAGRDLGTLKDESKRAYRALAAAGPPPVPLALLQMLPEFVLRRLPVPPAASVLASSIGTVPDEFRTIGDLTATAIAASAHYPGIGPDELASVGRGVMGWLTDAGSRTTVSVCGLDPAAFRDRTALSEVVTKEFADWGIEVRLW
ncbi:hypothetical protein BJF85_06475 [Saccharomonospora sp. CUA-673]|uniref:hypothetical protein n=1 Tax=Saccharomonospora sp. CUA-673 TaxID=1904969 RepID=UPI0009598F5A|nr:hypothetical protein [Saccharomonospora sp. CUA-673]OLT39989.1 hypothetical protein BJF85_06475 [Saccharomonospora sp. CUA-673]